MEEKDKRQRSKEEKLIFLKAAEEHGITEACQRFGIPHTPVKGKVKIPSLG